MRLRRAFGVLGLLALATPLVAQEQSRRLNQMIPLLEQRLPVLGIAHPGITAGRGGGRGGAAPETPPPPPALDVVAKETVGYELGDYEYNGYSPNSAQRFREYMEAILAAGGSMKTHPFISKVPIVHTDPAAATARIVEQLNAGHVGIWMQQVESAEEVEQAIRAMRFRSKGGTRPEQGIELAARYWGLSVEEYKDKADVWPLNPNGELIVWAIVESKEGIAKVREIAATPGIGVLWAGAGTLGGVYSATNPDGTRGARDEAGFNAAVASILAACKEFRVPCGYPASNPADIERLMAQGWSVFVRQGRNENGFAAVEAGRRLSGRATMP
jgi:4-hydroxy-2-oxoheptanedioate aldolase